MNGSASADTTDRFAFGANWQRFLSSLDASRVARAEESLKALLGVESLAGKRFLDIGSGSGLFSLAARRLGAQVHSFDFDSDSAACTRELKRRFQADDRDWTVERGSVLDMAYMNKLGRFDIVYSWGVLHHTGALWQAIENAIGCVAPGGIFAIAIYNDQGRASRRWAWVKRTYNRLPVALRFTVLVPAFIRLWGPTMLRDLCSGDPLKSWRNYSRERGMSPWRDVIDWVGGWPFEVAKPEAVFAFCRARGYTLTGLKTCAGGLGCNEFVFRHVP